MTPWTTSKPGFPVHHQLPELDQTHVDRVCDAIQPSSSVIHFFSHFQSFPATGSFPVSQFFASGGQSIRVLALASVLPMYNQDLSPLEWTNWISLQSRDSQESSTTPQFKSINSVSFFLRLSRQMTLHDINLTEGGPHTPAFVPLRLRV